MNKINIFRKRYIPDEIIDISSDTVLHCDDTLLVTSWEAIKRRKDIGYGISYAFLQDGYKISKVFDNDKNFIYWYIDIIRVIIDKSTNTYTLIDLLVDVKVMPDNKVSILDLDELSECMKNGVIQVSEMIEAIEKLNKVLQLIYDDKFPPQICNTYNLE